MLSFYLFLTFSGSHLWELMPFIHSSIFFFMIIRKGVCKESRKKYSEKVRSRCVTCFFFSLYSAVEKDMNRLAVIRLLNIWVKRSGRHSCLPWRVTQTQMGTRLIHSLAERINATLARIDCYGFIAKGHIIILIW